MKILTIALIIVSAGLSLEHGLDAFRSAGAEQAELMTDLGISNSLAPYIGVLSIIIGLMLLFPQTFFISNVLNAMIIVLIISFSLHAGNVRVAILEIPFLVMPLLLVWLKYPLKLN